MILADAAQLTLDLAPPSQLPDSYAYRASLIGAAHQFELTPDGLAWRSGRAIGKTSGFLTALILAPMVLAGYGVQVAVDPAWRIALAWLHGGTSLLFLAGYFIHLAITWEQARLDRDDGIA